MTKNPVIFRVEALEHVPLIWGRCRNKGRSEVIIDRDGRSNWVCFRPEFVQAEVGSFSANCIFELSDNTFKHR